MDESLDNYTEGKEPDKKNVMSCIIPFIWKSIKWQTNRKQIRDCLGTDIRGQGGGIVKRHEESLKAMDVCFHGLSCPAVRGIFWDQGWNQCPLHCKVES